MRGSRFLGLVVAAALLAGCGGGAPASAPGTAPSGSSAPASGGPASFNGVTLRIGLWGGDWKDNEQKYKGDPFEKATGAKVQYITGNPQDHAAKLLASQGGTPPMDIVQLDGFTMAQLTKAGLLVQLDYGKMPNLKDILPIAKTPTGAGWLLLVHGICYSPEGLQKLGAPVPKTADDLFSPKYAGKISIPTLETSMGPDLPLILAEENGGGYTNAEPGFKKLSQLKVYSYFTASTELASNFTSSNVDVAFWHSSRCARLNDSGFHVAFQPIQVDNAVEGHKVGIAELDYYAIVKGSKNEAAAYAYINQSFDPKEQFGWSVWGTTAPTTKAAIDLIQADPKAKEKIPYTIDDMNNMMRVDDEKMAAALPKWLDLWNQYLHK